MMSKNLSIIFSVFLLVVLGYAFVGIIADNIYEQTNIYTGTELPYTTSPTDGGEVLITGAQLEGTMLVERGGEDLSVNFTTANRDRKLYLVTSADAVAGRENGTAVNLTYNYQPENYLVHSTGRVLIALIVLFMALGLLLYIVVPIIKNMSAVAGRI